MTKFGPGFRPYPFPGIISLQHTAFRYPVSDGQTPRISDHLPDSASLYTSLCASAALIVPSAYALSISPMLPDFSNSS